jgi:hypothetical protein
MLKALTIFIGIAWPLLAGAQMTNASFSGTTLTPVINTTTHRLGNKEIKLQVLQYGDKKDIVFINLHDNETTSVEAAKRILERQGGMLIKI